MTDTVILQNENSRELAQVGDVLAGAWLPRYSIDRNKHKRYSIEMANTYVSYRGDIVKTQSMDCIFDRETLGYCSSDHLQYSCNVQSASYKEKKRDEEQERTKILTFPCGKRFDHYKFIDIEQDLAEIHGLEWQKFSGNSMNEFAYLPPTPIVHLFQLLIYDVIMFEELHSRILSHASLLPSLGDEYSFPVEDGNKVQLTFNGSDSDDSYFSLNDLPIKLSAITLAGDKPVLVYEFDSVGKLNVVSSIGSQQSENQGESFYHGKILVDIETGDIESASMHEALTIVTKSRTGKVMPAHKRRKVSMNNINQN